MADRTIRIAGNATTTTPNPGSMRPIENLYVPIYMHGREVGYNLKRGESLVVTEEVWNDQVIAKQMERDNLLTVTP